jgi:hypothetical protein
MHDIVLFVIDAIVSVNNVAACQFYTNQPKISSFLDKQHQLHSVPRSKVQLPQLKNSHSFHAKAQPDSSPVLVNPTTWPQSSSVKVRYRLLPPVTLPRPSPTPRSSSTASNPSSFSKKAPQPATPTTSSALVSSCCIQSRYNGLPLSHPLIPTSRRSSANFSPISPSLTQKRCTSRSERSLDAIPG